MRSRAFVVRLAVAIAALQAACGGGNGELRGDTFSADETTYDIGDLARGWEAIDAPDPNDLAWANDGLAAVIQVNSSCDPALDIPLEALTTHLLIGFTEREIVTQERVPMASREALRTHVRAKLDGVLREMLLFVLKKDGCVYDFSLVAPPGAEFERARAEYEAWLAGFRTHEER